MKLHSKIANRLIQLGGPGSGPHKWGPDFNRTNTDMRFEPHGVYRIKENAAGTSHTATYEHNDARSTFGSTGAGATTESLGKFKTRTEAETAVEAHNVNR